MSKETGPLSKIDLIVEFARAQNPTELELRKALDRLVIWAASMTPAREAVPVAEKVNFSR